MYRYMCCKIQDLLAVGEKVYLPVLFQGRKPQKKGHYLSSVNRLLLKTNQYLTKTKYDNCPRRCCSLRPMRTCLVSSSNKNKSLSACQMEKLP